MHEIRIKTMAGEEDEQQSVVYTQKRMEFFAVEFLKWYRNQPPTGAPAKLLLEQYKSQLK